MRPKSEAEIDRREFLKDETAEMIEAVSTSERRDLIVDFGGIENLLKKFSGELRFVETMEEFGIRVVALHVVGPDVADLRFLREVEGSGVFKPKAAAIVLNASLVDPDVQDGAAFGEVAASPIVAAFSGRGGQAAIMPKLPQIAKIEKLIEAHGPVPLRDLTDAKRGLGFWDARLLQKWLDEKVPEMRQQLGSCLP